GLVGRGVDGRADLYALGALLFHAASGRPPFVAADAAELLRLHAVVPAPALASVRPQCSPVLAEVVARLLAKDPDDRYQTGEAVAAALAPLLGLVPEAVPEDRPATALVGRGPELQQLTQAWQQTRRTAERLATGAGALPVIVAMEGEAGAGKSRLVAEFIDRVAGPSAAIVLRSRCSDDGLPFAAVREALDGVALRASADTAVARELAARLRTALAELAGLLRGLSPALATLVAGPPARGDPKLTREQVDGAVVDGLARLTATGGLVWIVDDLQWIDEGSARLLGRFAARSLEGPALLLCCVRGETGGERIGSGPLPAARGGSGPLPAARGGSGPMPAALGAEPDAPRPRDRARSGPVDVPEGRSWPGSGPLGRRSGPRPAARSRGAWSRFAELLPASLYLWLGPLPTMAVGQLMAGLLGGRRIPPELVELVARRSDGMPLAVLELVRVMLDEGVLHPSWDVWVADAEALAALPLGGDALRLISGRIAHLSERTGEVLRLAAVCGDRFEPALLARAGAIAAAEVEAAIDEADAAGLIERGRAGYNFVHHRVREALLAALAVEQRQALHQAVAATLGPREVYARAHHYLAGTLRDTRAVKEACLAAALFALSEAADEEAHRFLSRAQGFAGADEPALVDALAEACLRTGRLVEAEQHIDRGLATAHEPWRRSALLRRRARAAQLRRDHGRALATMAGAFAALGERLPGHRPIDAVASAWWWLLAVIVGATGVGRGTLRGPARAHGALVAAYLTEAYVMAYLAFDRRTMVQAVLRHYYVAERLGEGPELAMAYCNYATLLVSLGHRARGLAHARAAEALGQRLGQPTLARVHERLMVVYEFAGEPRVCEAIGRQIHAHERRWLDTWGQTATGEVLGFNLWLRGRDEAALAALQPLIQELAARGPGVAGQQAQVLLQVIAGLALTALGRIGEADACFDAAARGFASAPEDRYQNAVLLTCGVMRAAEQGTLGAPLEELIARHAQLELGERRVPFYGRFFYPFVAYARLMQALGSDASVRPAALGRLAQAIAEAE
ncbi:MAG TPA: AAA family ATPase, partial [Nannocystis sp.]